MNALRKTRPAKYLTVLRVLAAIPLVGIGAQHLFGMAPMLPILEGARIPFAEFFAMAVPILEVMAGLGLILGLYARVGALVALVTMVVAIYAHLVHNWADEPTIVLPSAVLLAVAQVLWSGAGAFSADLAASPES